MDYPIGWEMRKDTEKFTEDFTPPGVEVHCLYGSGVDTVERWDNTNSLAQIKILTTIYSQAGL